MARKKAEITEVTTDENQEESMIITIDIEEEISEEILIDITENAKAYFRVNSVFVDQAMKDWFSDDVDKLKSMLRALNNKIGKRKIVLGKRSRGFKLPVREETIDVSYKLMKVDGRTKLIIFKR